MGDQIDIDIYDIFQLSWYLKEVKLLLKDIFIKLLSKFILLR